MLISVASASRRAIGIVTVYVQAATPAGYHGGMQFSLLTLLRFVAIVAIAVRFPEATATLIALAPVVAIPLALIVAIRWVCRSQNPHPD